MCVPWNFAGITIKNIKIKGKKKQKTIIHYLFQNFYYNYNFPLIRREIDIQVLGLHDPMSFPKGILNYRVFY